MAAKKLIILEIETDDSLPHKYPNYGINFNNEHEFIEFIAKSMEADAQYDPEDPIPFKERYGFEVKLSYISSKDESRVSFEEAKKLKEQGFNEPCDFCYNPSGQLEELFEPQTNEELTLEEFHEDFWHTHDASEEVLFDISAPTLEQAEKFKQSK